MALSLTNLGSVAKAQSDYPEARSLHERCIAIFQELGDQQGVALSLNHLGDVARAQGDRDSARARYLESLALFKKLGSKWSAANVLADLGDLALDQEDVSFARQQFEESLALFGDLGDRRGVTRLLEGFAAVAAREGQAERALRLAGAAAVLREGLSAPLMPADRTKLEQRLRPARQSLGEAMSAAAWREGRAMSIEHAISYATEAMAG